MSTSLDLAKIISIVLSVGGLMTGKLKLDLVDEGK